MSGKTIITFRQIGDCYDIDPELIREFAEFGLYPVIASEGESGIERQYLGRVARVISLYRSLGVNKEGIDIILELREEISKLQERVEALQREEQILRFRLEYDNPEILRSRGLLVEIED